MLRAERQSARMSKITNDGLTQSGTGCFMAALVYPYGNSGVKGLKHIHRHNLHRVTILCLNLGPQSSQPSTSNAVA